MGWSYLGIFFLVALAVCLVGFYKYVYFLSIGYAYLRKTGYLDFLCSSLCGTDITSIFPCIKWWVAKFLLSHGRVL